MSAPAQSQLLRLVAVMRRLRADCPWDAEQTNLSLVHYLVEECLELVEAIEAGDDHDLAEELGDVLLQVVFHAEIAAETGRFDIEQVAGQVCDKLIARHPYVFGTEEVPADLLAAWETRKKSEKGRQSALEGIPQRMSALARAHKVIGRARHHGLGPDLIQVPNSEVDPGQIGVELLALVGRADALGVDPEQALRAAVRELEQRVLVSEAAAI